jgi:hypothetical protein
VALRSFCLPRHLSFGNVKALQLGEIRMTFAEGVLDGQFAQVFGAWRHAPAAVPSLPGTAIQLHYGGYSDFQSNQKRKGELDLYATLGGPLFPEGDTIGDLAHPMHLVDEQLALPAVAGCRPLNRLVNHRLGLPSPSGQNVFQQTSYVRFKLYP